MRLASARAIDKARAEGRCLSIQRRSQSEISRYRLAELRNEDLSREYQAIIAYVVYSQVLSGAQYMDIAA